MIVTQIHARVEGDTYFPEEFDLSLFETVSSKSYTKMRKILMIYHPIPQEKGSLMERSIFGFFTAMLCLVCLLAGAQLFVKSAYGLSVLTLVKCIYQFGQ